MDELAQLFGAYREALPDPEPSANFTPGVWRKIEARRLATRMFRRFAEAFVTVAAVLTILIGSVLIPHIRKAPVYSATYIDVLAAQNSPEESAALDPVQQMPPAEAPQ